MSRPSMEKVWMFAAVLLSKRSQCSKLQVGCIVTTQDLRSVISNGYNGGPRKIEYVCLPDSCSDLHAETNALINAGSSIKDKVVFVTCMPCLSCCFQIVNSGASKVVYLRDYKKDSHHWDMRNEVISTFKKAKIKLVKYD